MGDLPPPYADNAPPKPPPYSQEPDAQGLPPPPPPVGFQDPAPQVYVTTPTVVSPPPPPAQVVVVQTTFSCPICKMGFVREEFTLCGICLGVFFFPLGLICCILMRVKRCSNCRAIIA